MCLSEGVFPPFFHFLPVFSYITFLFSLNISFSILFSHSLNKGRQGMDFPSGHGLDRIVVFHRLARRATPEGSFGQDQVMMGKNNFSRTRFSVRTRSFYLNLILPLFSSICSLLYERRVGVDFSLFFFCLYKSCKLNLELRRRFTRWVISEGLVRHILSKLFV